MGVVKKEDIESSSTRGRHHFVVCSQHPSILCQGVCYGRVVPYAQWWSVCGLHVRISVGSIHAVAPAHFVRQAGLLVTRRFLGDDATLKRPKDF
jgi:hypothetical protein